jgi:PTH1 family peptidyl-tRNA hydrolase
MAWLVAGLGNPDDRYASSRHNVGRMVADELARAAGERFRKARFLPAEVAEVREGDERLVLVRSTRYMNESGPSYAGVAKKQGIDPDHVIAVHDELELLPGRLRVKLGGGNAGHNGLRSLQQALRTPEFLRVRIGIGRPPGRQDPADFVLSPIAPKDEGEIAGWVDAAADAVRSLVRDGLSRTQERFNGNGPRATD